MIDPMGNRSQLIEMCITHRVGVEISLGASNAGKNLFLTLFNEELRAVV